MAQAKAEELIARATLAALVGVHAITKFTAHDAFVAKFELPDSVGYLAGVAELAGAIGLIVGGAISWPGPVLAGYRAPKYRRVDAGITLLSVICIYIVQFGAIFMVHWPTWFYYKYGMEYNVALVMFGIIILIGTFRKSRR